MAKVKITLGELEHNMWEFNRKHPEKQDEQCITGVIVYKASNWGKKCQYTEKERSYRVGNNNRCFQSGKIANSLFGDCLDEKDVGVRLDWYKWDVDYCYMD